MTFLSIASSSVRYSLIETGSLCDLSLRKKSISIGVALHSNEGGGMKHFAAALALAAVTGLAAAQSFPTRAITLISPFPPGGSTDTTARIIAERMRAPLGQSVVVATRGGAAAGARRHGQDPRQSFAEALAGDSGRADLGRERHCRALCAGMVRAFRAEGNAEGDHRQAERCDGRRARRPGDTHALCGSR